MAVGAKCYPKSNNESAAGKVYIFDQINSFWWETWRLVPDDWQGGWAFGQSLALEGDLLVVGAPRWAGCSLGRGAAYVFEYGANGWEQTARLCASNTEGNGQNFGESTAIVGRTIIIGDSLAYPTFQGEVYVFEKIGGVWTEVQMLNPSGGSPLARSFGSNIAAWGDRLLVGAPAAEVGGINYGAVFIYERIQGRYELVGSQLAAVPEQSEGFGFQVALSGSYGFAGTVGDNPHGEHSGSVTVFPVGFGERYCEALPNSMGRGAELCVRGSTSVAANDLYFSAQPLPPDQPGIIYCGLSQMEVPFGHGLICVNGSILRSPPAYAVNTLLQRRINLNQPPYANLLIPGSRWNFQLWYRDPASGGPAFNTSDALSILFEP